MQLAHCSSKTVQQFSKERPNKVFIGEDFQQDWESLFNQRIIDFKKTCDTGYQLAWLL